ncbi:MAG: hypothetical protein VCB25_11110 [Myxococcota bacterium]
MQREIIGYALDLLESARLPRTTVQAPFRWSQDASWKQGYARVDPEEADRLRRAGDSRQARQQQVQASEPSDSG